MSSQKIIISLVFLLAIFGAYLFIHATWLSSWEIANVPPKNDVVVAFGDSLVDGVGATTGKDFVSLLSHRLNSEIINLGVPGDTSESGLRRIDEVLAYDPGTVILVLGGNDAIRRIPLSETKANLGVIIGTLTESGSAVILVGVRGALFDDPYDTMYEELARAHGAALVPSVLEGILLRPEFTADQIHPNDAGYAIVADRIYEVIEPLLRK